MLSTQCDYDIAILGGGCTALNFAMAYAQMQSDKKVLILEAREHYNHDRTWSFWLNRDDEFSHRDIVKKTWGGWNFSSEAEIYSHHSNIYEYATIASDDFYDKAVRLIENDKRQTTVMDCNVKDISKNEIYEIQTSQGIFKAQQIIDTRNKKQSSFEYRAQYYQIFYGYEIISETPVFDEKTVGLMQEIKNVEGGMEFIYTLPFSNSHALIEYTLFTQNHCNPDELEEGLRAYIDQTLGLQNYKITHTEKAVLPMGQLKTKQPYASQHYIYSGTQAGALRESSGYGFLRNYHWAQNAVQNIDDIKSYRNPSMINRFMDRHFIKTLIHYPERSADIFMTLAHKADADTFARFMSEQHNIVDLLKVIMAVPKTPFLKALVKV